MAPLLIPGPEHQQDELPTPAPMAKKTVKPVIPAVPRVFEKRRVTSNVQTLNFGSVSREQNEQKGSHLQSSAENTPVISADQHTPKSAPERDALGRNTAIYAPETTSITENLGTSRDMGQMDSSCNKRSLYVPPEDETSSTSTFNQGSGIQGHVFQLPPAFYPMPAHSNPAVYPIDRFRPDGFLNQPQPRIFSPYTLDRNIVFGGEPDSNQSSPRSMPSAGSTTYTQPTPLSDATSCRSQSLYQGYGHLPNTYERYVPSKLVFSPSEDRYSQPAHTSPPGSDYGVSPPQISSNAQLPSSQVFPQPPPTQETPPPDPLNTYLLEQFNNPEFADCSLRLETEGQATAFMLHGVVIAQNPTLKALLQSVKSFDSEGKKTLTLDTSVSHLSVPVMTSALRSYYGGPLPEGSQIINEMDLALAYLATGRLLQMPVYEDIGTTALLRSLTIDNLEKALFCALPDAANPASLPDNDITQVTGRPALPSRRLLAGLLDFIVANFPDPFVLDTCAPSSTSLGGYPPIPSIEPQQQRSKPELMAIRFGDFPSENLTIPSAESTTISSVLLSVPFSVLQQVLQSLGQSVTQSIARPIIEERERRRLQALEAGTEPSPTGSSSHVPDDLERHSREERVVETESGTIITRVSTEQN